MFKFFLIIISLLIWISALAAIIAHQKKKFDVFKWLKPITTILIMLLALGIIYNKGSHYSIIIASSLIFALIGDIFLIQYKHLLRGIIFFSFAHFGFALAFMGIQGFQSHLWLLFALLAANTSYFLFLKKKLGKFLVPIALYMLIISFMNWQALGLFYLHQTNVHFGIAVASLLFTFSDSVIAFNIFHKNFKLSEPLILSTYWLAIYLFTIVGLYL